MNGILPQLLIAAADAYSDETELGAHSDRMIMHAEEKRSVVGNLWSQLTDSARQLSSNVDPNASLTLGVAITVIGASLLYRFRE
jgi:hypothetical protein